MLSNIGATPISIHALHEESDTTLTTAPVRFNISIHALHEESDINRIRQRFNIHISIHALHEESDKHRSSHRDKQYDFNPRSP